MIISDFAIKKPVVTVSTMLALVVFGLFALSRLQTDEFPEINPPFVAISIPYPGASPETVEREVVDPIEEAIAGISGVDEMRSTSLDGYASILVSFVFEKDPQQATQDIRDAISEIRADLPPEMKEPILARWDPNSLPIVSLTLTSTRLDAPALTRIADPGVTRALRGLPGVAEVKVSGGVEREMTVELQPQALAAADVSVGQVVQALAAQNLAAPVGRLTGAVDERTIRLKGRLQSAVDFEKIPVVTRAGHTIRLGEVATVRDGTEEPRSLALFNGKTAVGIDIIKSQGASTTEVSNRVREAVEQLRPTLPAGVELATVQDAGPRVTDSVHNVEEALFEGALLTVLVVFLFLNSWRSTVITGLALPVSVISAFVAVWAAGFTLNTMSLLGLSLAIGILIDDAIVVRENIVRHVEMGEDHMTASHRGTSEIGLAVAATTLSIVAVFVPIAFMGGIGGQWMAPFALTIAFSVLVSLFVSFSLDPMLSAYWADPELEAHERSWVSRKLDVFNRWFDRQAENYKRLIAWALDHRLAMVGIAVATFVLAVALPVLGVLGSEFFPQEDRSELTMRVETPAGSNLDYTRLKAEEVARLARRHPEVAYTYTTVGGEGGTVDQANVYVRLKPRSERDVSQQELGETIRAEAKRIGGATTWIVTDMFGGQKTIQIELRGPDIAVLNRLAAQAEALVRQVPGAVDVGLSTKGQKPELEVDVNRGLAGSIGVSVGDIAQSLRPAFAGIDAGDWVDPTGETRDVMVRLTPESRRRAADLRQLPLVVTGPSGATTIPLSQVASVQEGLGPATITHVDRDRVIAVEANPEGRPLAQVVQDIQSRLATLNLPPGYHITQGGQTKSQKEVFTSIFAALGIAVLLMYLILVMQFGSFVDPIAIMVSLPLSLIGVVLGLTLTGNTLNIMSLLGVILLFGIVAKNAILLIDFAKWARERGAPLREALIEAGAIRLRPILMTTFALVAGMLPVALGRGEGAQGRAPLGIAVIGGVITSTLLTLVVIPTVYEILAKWKESLVRRFFPRMAHAGHGALVPPDLAPEAGDD